MYTYDKINVKAFSLWTIATFESVFLSSFLKNSVFLPNLTFFVSSKLIIIKALLIFRSQRLFKSTWGTISIHRKKTKLKKYCVMYMIYRGEGLWERMHDLFAHGKKDHNFKRLTWYCCLEFRNLHWRRSFRRRITWSSYNKA